LGGILAAWWVYVREPWLAAAARTAWPRAHRWLFNKYYVDEAYDRTVVKPLHRGGRLFFGIDEYFIDGIIWFVTVIPRALAFGLRAFQRGALQGYGLSMAAGAVVFLLLALSL
jgi:NADH-quinone oxidoreductase subunit L